MQNQVFRRAPIFVSCYWSLIVGPEIDLGDAQSFVLTTSDARLMWLLEKIHIKGLPIVVVTMLDTGNTGSVGMVVTEMTPDPLRLVEAVDQFIGDRDRGPAHNHDDRGSVLIVSEVAAKNHFGFTANRKPVHTHYLATAMALLGHVNVVPSPDPEVLKVADIRAHDVYLERYYSDSKPRGHGALPMLERRAPKKIAPTGLRSSVGLTRS